MAHEKLRQLCGELHAAIHANNGPEAIRLHKELADQIDALPDEEPEKNPGGLKGAKQSASEQQSKQAGT